MSVTRPFNCARMRLVVAAGISSRKSPIGRYVTLSALIRRCSERDICDRYTPTITRSYDSRSPCLRSENVSPAASTDLCSTSDKTGDSCSITLGRTIRRTRGCTGMQTRWRRCLTTRGTSSSSAVDCRVHLLLLGRRPLLDTTVPCRPWTMTSSDLCPRGRVLEKL